MTDNAPPKPRSSSNVTRILLVMTGLGLLVFAACVALVVYLAGRGETAKIASDTFLEVRLAGPITDSPPPPNLFDDPNAPRMHTALYADAIRAAADDERLVGMLLQLDGPSLGIASATEIRDAIRAFRDAGKPCVAMAEAYDNTSYLLASACDRVVLAPSGVAMVSGLSVTQSYYADTFEWLGIHPQFEHVGDFKSAVEPYERTGPSDAASEAMDYLLDGIYDTFVQTIAEGRGIDAQAARDLIDRPPMSPAEALERGLVDALAFPDAVRALVHQATEDDWPERLSQPIDADVQKAAKKRFTSITELAKTVRKQQKAGERHVAVVHLEGPIMSGKADGGLFGSQIIADRTVRGWLREVREDDSVAAVVLRVNSPGGSGLASDMIWREIQLIQQQGLPVVVSMGDTAASGGYFIAAPADRIFAQPATITGSIGVFGGKMNLAGAYDKLGVSLHQYKRGELADLFSPTSDFSEEGREVYRRFMSDFYTLFLDKVADGRGMERDAVHEVAQGRVWTGTQALERGLVDELGGLHQATQHAAERASLGESWGVKRWPRQKDIFEMLMEDLQGGGNASVQLELPAALQRDAQRVQHLLMLDALLQGGAPIALLPGELTLR